MADAQKRKYKRRVGFYEPLQHYRLKRGWRHYFERYTKNLRYDDEGVYSYGTQIIELDWIKLTAKRLGNWSRMTSKHQSYAIEDVANDWGFKEIK